ncbi:MAG TPA: TolC family protein [Ohtaekwangia sp.]|nr:TolC family protein [Ohtaekwangia sp.]
MKTKPPENHLIGCIFVAVILLSQTLKAQTPLVNYVAEGLESNIILQQKKISLQQAKQSLQIAKSYFLPSINVLADYTSGQGGRSIGIPVGDLLNPVYTSLNQLTETNSFPQIENVSQDFFPNNFYDAKVRASVPIINTDLHVNRSIQQQKIVLQEYEVTAYKRQLVLEIKTAYYNYLSALEAIKIYESALELMRRNVALNESLLKNGKSLPANYLRSKSELERVKADLNNATNQSLNAKKYFNFLLNKDLDTAIEIHNSFDEVGPVTDPITVEQREELYMLKTAQEINASSLQLYKLSRLPKVNGFIDLGTQASDWQFNNDSRYYLVGIQLSLPIFQGFRNNTLIRQTKLDVEKARLDVKNTEAQLQVAADIAQHNLQTARQNYAAAEEQLTAAKSYYHLIDRGYKEGVNSLIEFIDARNQLTSSELQLNLRQFEMLVAAAHVERETSSYILNH